MNVTGSDRTSMLVRDLSPGTVYSFTVQAYNPQGVSHHSAPPLTASTLGILFKYSALGLLFHACSCAQFLLWCHFLGICFNRYSFTITFVSLPPKQMH